MVDATNHAIGASDGGGSPRLGARLKGRIGGDGAKAVAQRFAGLAYLLRLANAGLVFLTQILLARWMGADEFGVYVYVWTWVLLLSALAHLGLGSSPQRFIPTYIGRRELDLLRGFVVAGRWLAFGLASTLSLTIALALAFSGVDLGSWPVQAIYLGLTCVPLMVLTEVQGGMARSFDWPALALAPAFLWRPVLLILIAAIIHALGYPADALTVMIASMAACWLTALCQLILLDRRLARRIESGPRRMIPLTWLRLSLPQFMVDGFYQLLLYCDVIVLERFVAPDEIAVYYAAVKLVSIVTFVYFSVAAASAHKFSEYHVGERKDELDAFMAASIRWTFVPSLALSIVVLAAGQDLLACFGTGFEKGYALLPILLGGLLARASIGPVERLLAMVGQQRICALVYALAFAANIGLNLFLVPRLGLAGAATATTAAMVLETVLLYLVTKRRLSLHAFVLGGRASRMPA
jgi:O-antigen/teichoic acid export membrane protein